MGRQAQWAVAQDAGKLACDEAHLAHNDGTEVAADGGPRRRSRCNAGAPEAGATRASAHDQSSRHTSPWARRASHKDPAERDRVIPAKVADALATACEVSVQIRTTDNSGPIFVEKKIA